MFTWIRIPLRIFTIFLAASVLLLPACSEEERLDDLTDASYHLVDQDSSQVTFPSDMQGEIVLIGYVYTNCPDFCPTLTANMLNVHNGLDTTDDVRFITISFDPERDTPSVLRSYRDIYNISGDRWQFLTGEKAQVDAVLERLGVRYEKAEDSEERGADRYLINHNDRITLVDQRGRVVMHYVGSRTPSEYLVEDINALR